MPVLATIRAEVAPLLDATVPKNESHVHRKGAHTKAR